MENIEVETVMVYHELEGRQARRPTNGLNVSEKCTVFTTYRAENFYNNIRNASVALSLWSTYLESIPYHICINNLRHTRRVHNKTFHYAIRGMSWWVGGS